MLSCAGADRLQTGMRGAFGKPQGTCTRVSIGQVLLSVRCKDSNSHHAQEALRRAKFKFPGRQKIIVSRKWGFTKFSRVEYMKYKAENKIVPDGVNAKVILKLHTCMHLPHVHARRHNILEWKKKTINVNSASTPNHLWVVAVFLSANLIYLP
ncbi:hypothetical protein FH972_001188 [Carpinus fangiana]|uniref:Uncharacterized protein n=1 Tax=Carpinus fangiana TaxID=176857 RepID=A0A5N6QB63_9ROSI|nr:hypothetical protein FH972_001188 [Carpinus fangiana]